MEKTILEKQVEIEEKLENNPLEMELRDLFFNRLYEQTDVIHRVLIINAKNKIKI